MQTRYIYEVVPQVIQNTLDVSIVLHKRPVACLVYEDGLLGFSTWNKKKEKTPFNKKKARFIAIARLTNGSKVVVPNRKMINIRGEKTTLINEVDFYLAKMESRATANLF